MKRITNILLFGLGLGLMPVSAHLFRGNPGQPYKLESVDSLLPVKRVSTVMASGNTSGDYNRYSFQRFSIPVTATVGKTKEGREIEAYYFPGKSPYRALVIGGMHGSELSSITVAKEIIKKLSNGVQPYYSVLVIPVLFPDNAEAAVRNPKAMGGLQNIGRYTYKNSVDPNRQMPSPGKWHSEETCEDHMGRKIETENAILLDLIRDFRPDRIANVHAIRDTSRAGIYADPRTDSKGIALGYESDSALAIRMADFIHRKGGNVLGNKITEKPSSLYYKDPVPVAKGKVQPRNFCGAKLPDNRGSGVSLGSWASTAVENYPDPAYNRPAIRLFTIEFPGYRSPEFYTSSADQLRSRQNVSLYAESVLEIFLGNYYPEYEEAEASSWKHEFANN